MLELPAPGDGNNPLPLNDHGQPGSNATDPDLNGQKLAVNLYIKGTSGPITYHQEALQTSYLSAPNAGDRTHDTDDNSLSRGELDRYRSVRTEQALNKRDRAAEAEKYSLADAPRRSHAGTAPPLERCSLVARGSKWAL
jgi:hypothetical protein